MNFWTKMMAVVGLLLLVAGTSAAHAALLKLNRGRLRHLALEGVPRARSLLSLVGDTVSMETTLAATNAAALALGAVAAALLLVAYLGDSVAALVSSGFASLMALLWVQFASRAAGTLHPEGTLYLLRWPLQATTLLLRPAAQALRLLTRLVVRKEPVLAVGGSVVDEELRMIVDAAEGDGALEEGEKEMIHSIFEMGETTAREIMVPRVDIVSVEAVAPLSEVLAQINSRGHSRIPIYEESIDNVVGIVYAKDLLRHMEEGSLEEPARALGRPPHFIPESKKIDELLREMQQGKVHMAIVLDEYGGTAGLVTIEDLLEEIVGEIQDEYDMEEKPIERLSELEAVFDARVSIHDVNETLALSLADGEYDTVGGLVYDCLGKIPVVGDEVQVGGMRLRVLSTVGKRIKKVKIRVDSAPDSDRNGDG